MTETTLAVAIEPEILLEADIEIGDDIHAEWCLKKLKELESEKNRLVNVCIACIEQYNNKKDEIEKKYDDKASFFKSQLARYFERVKKVKTKTQEKYSLPSGSLIKRIKPKKLIVDNQKLLKYLQENNYKMYIETTVKPKWGEFKKLLKHSDNKVIDTHGQIVDGVVAEEQPDEFVVKLKED